MSETDEMARLTEIAVTLGKAQGLTATQAINDMTTALGRQSLMILNNIGRGLNADELPSTPLHALARKAMFGQGTIGRFWAQRVRPWLQPEHQKKIESAWSIARKQWHQEYIAAVLGKAQEAADA